MKKFFLCLSFFLAACSRNTPSVREVPPPDPKVALAQCLTARGVTLYSASWCRICQRQAELFGSVAYAQVPLVECEPPGRRGQTPECRWAEIVAYPTWVFPDNRRVEGLMTLPELARESFCPWTSSE